MSNEFTDLERQILDRIQCDFPLRTDPYAELAADANCTIEEAHETVIKLREGGIIRRIGGSFVAAKLGYVSTLVAATVDPDRLEETAAAVSSYPEVTHNYERNHSYNLWFTITAASRKRMEQIANELRMSPGVSALHLLPALKTFKIKVNFNFESGKK
jgi:DNA-binding Lrp family transcriptional regulator